MLREFEYQVSSKLNGLITLKYTRLFKEKIGFFIEVRNDYAHLLGKGFDHLHGTFRNMFHARVGCTF